MYKLGIHLYTTQRIAATDTYTQFSNVIVSREKIIATKYTLQIIMKHHDSRNTFKEYIDYQTGSNAPKTKMVLGPSAQLSHLEYHYLRTDFKMLVTPRKLKTIPQKV